MNHKADASEAFHVILLAIHYELGNNDPAQINCECPTHAATQLNMRSIVYCRVCHTESQKNISRQYNFQNIMIREVLDCLTQINSDPADQESVPEFESKEYRDLAMSNGQFFNVFKLIKSREQNVSL